ncbi:DapH/DapD/GlmU-related protein [Synechococcus elongatus]|uniref:DapH/DapD/GlmU-related protein n=1 Tax=Synechococcus elongatus PCC 11802 TaxID=2283154 RepID=A0AAT9K312_SYNEL|nr:DapH/DapD/GlmU-related protein [Synechococcus elongatus]QFZ91317.1 putative colanic acid biosynthesis acetyltransferase [Synechococcus elongatus PCC 11802]
MRGLRYYTIGDYGRRALWAVVQPFFRYSPRWIWGWRNLLLRSFGAQVAAGVRIYPTARLHQPWNLQIGARTTIAWQTTLYALGPIVIGQDCVISQGSHLCAGSHDFRDPEFPLLKLPIQIGDGVWIASEAFIGPGVTLGDRAVVGARSVVVRSVAPGTVVAGNPARPVGDR